MSRRTTAAGRGPWLAALAVTSGVVVVRSVLLLADGLDRLQRLTLGDPLWAALAALVGLLLAPYVKERPGAPTIPTLARRRPAQEDDPHGRVPDELQPAGAGSP